MNTSALSTHVLHPDSLNDIIDAVRLEFNRRAISPKPTIVGSDESSFSMMSFDSILGSNGFEPGS